MPDRRDERHHAAPTADFDLAGRAYEDACQDDGLPSPAWTRWAFGGFAVLVALGFMAGRGWERLSVPYASWYWPDQSAGLQIAHGGTRWVMDPRAVAVALPDKAMVLVGHFTDVPYYAPRQGGGGGPAVVGPVYLRVAPGRYLPLVQGGPSPDLIRRRTLEGEPILP